MQTYYDYSETLLWDAFYFSLLHGQPISRVKQYSLKQRFRFIYFIFLLQDGVESKVYVCQSRYQKTGDIILKTPE